MSKIENLISTDILTMKSNIPICNIKSFVVTGITTSGKRFVKKYSCGENSRTALETAMMINLYRGSVWAELNTSKRKLLKRVYN